MPFADSQLKYSGLVSPLDGNKRAATACMAAFLRLNGYRFKPRADEPLATMIRVAEGTVSYEELTG